MADKLPQAEWMPITDIRKNPDNPRFIRDEKFKLLVKSIRNFPQMLALRPIVIDEGGMVLGGNMRYLACKTAGIEKVPVVRAVDLTEEQKAEFIVKDNAPMGEWDYDALANQYDTEELADWGVDIPTMGDEDDEDEDEPAPRKAAELVICPKCSHEFVPER
jgi:ParB-like chromosome segregation protein Spo0J